VLQTGFGSGSGFLPLGSGLESARKNLSPNTSASQQQIHTCKSHKQASLKHENLIQYHITATPHYYHKTICSFALSTTLQTMKTSEYWIKPTILF